MKKIIGGKKYDTDTAKKIEVYDNGRCGDFSYVEETLYRKRTGEFFLYGYGGATSKYAVSCGCNEWSSGEAITPLTENQAKEWMEAHSDAETYEEVFGEVEE